MRVFVLLRKPESEYDSVEMIGIFRTHESALKGLVAYVLDVPHEVKYSDDFEIKEDEVK